MVKLTSRPPAVGEKVYTAGWGRTGFDETTNKTEPMSDVLMSLQLVVKSVEDQYVFTKVTSSDGRITDTCRGEICT